MCAWDYIDMCIIAMPMTYMHKACHVAHMHRQLCRIFEKIINADTNLTLQVLKRHAELDNKKLEAEQCLLMQSNSSARVSEWKDTVPRRHWFRLVLNLVHPLNFLIRLLRP